MLKKGKKYQNIKRWHPRELIELIIYIQDWAIGLSNKSYRVCKTILQANSALVESNSRLKTEKGKLEEKIKRHYGRLNDYLVENFSPFYVSLSNFSVIGLLDQKLLAFKMVTQQKNTL